MRSLIAVSSESGNTYKLARYIQKGIEKSTLVHLQKEEVLADDYDFILIGFYVDKGKVDSKALNFMHKLKHHKVALFATLGGNPQGSEAQKVMTSATALLEQQDNHIVGTLMRQGKIAPEVLESMYKLMPYLKEDKEHLERIAKASTHPDANDKIISMLTATHWLKKALSL